MNTLKILFACNAVAVAASFSVAAQTASDPADMPGMSMPGMKMEQGAGSDMTAGEVRKIDKANQKVTLKHGDIENLDMPGMTMVFKVKEPAMLDAVQVGSKVRFRAEKVDGAIVVTALESVK